jgi:hypothetical protein
VSETNLSASAEAEAPVDLAGINDSIARYSAILGTAQDYQARKDSLALAIEAHAKGLIVSTVDDDTEDLQDAQAAELIETAEVFRMHLLGCVDDTVTSAEANSAKAEPTPLAA